MSLHKTPLTEIEKEGLQKHGLAIEVPSQLSDAFRQGMKWAQAAPLQPRTAEPVITYREDGNDGYDLYCEGYNIGTACNEPFAKRFTSPKPDTLALDRQVLALQGVLREIPHPRDRDLIEEYLQWAGLANKALTDTDQAGREAEARVLEDALDALRFRPDPLQPIRAIDHGEMVDYIDRLRNGGSDNA